MKVIHSEDQMQYELLFLADDAAKSAGSAGRVASLEPDVFRTPYQRDRDRILHTKAFRRLSHKTQVFLAAEGDHFRTRLTHTLEVAQIARTVARALGLNEDLTEAIALGHDLGHTPFGHTGEEAICRCLRKLSDNPQSNIACEIPDKFIHNEQSLRVVDVLENNGVGLNLTDEVRDGILHHSGRIKPRTLEGCVVAIADRIAYVNHDIDDAIRAGILKTDDLPELTRTYIGESHSERIESLVCDLVDTSYATGEITQSDEMARAFLELRSFLFENVYQSEVVRIEAKKALRLVNELFFYYLEHIDEVPEEYRWVAGDDYLQAVIDYLAGMTDRYARRCFEERYVPQSTHYLH